MPDDDLTPEEQKYFDSKGEADLEAKPEAEPEKKAEPEPAKEPDKDADLKEDDDAKPGKVVPLKALHEAREEARKLRERLEAREGDFNKLTGRLETLEKIAAEPLAKEPSWDDEPIEAGKRLTEDIRSIKERFSQDEQRKQIQAVVSAREAEFSKEHADYADALVYLSDARAKELEVFGLDPVQIQQQIQIEASQMVQAALQSNRNPAELAYTLAQRRGYAPKSNGVDKEPAKIDQAKKLETIARGQEAGASVSGAGTPQPKSTLDAIMSMDDDEFAKVTENDWKKLWR